MFDKSFKVSRLFDKRQYSVLYFSFKYRNRDPVKIIMRREY